MHFNKQTAKYSGKVRDVYTIDNTHVVMHASDRISAFDVILPKPIPYKGQVLNQIAEYFLHATADIVPNWLLAVPHPSVSIGLLCKPLPIEVVVRGYLAGHAWRTYKTGERVLCGVTLPDGLKENDPLPQPIITPTTKAHEGHDMDISREEILKQGLVAPNLYAQVEEVALRLFARGSQMAKEKGLILVDTKYEFGMYNGTLYLIDEVHTPDSSRYFYATGYQQRQANGEPQTQLSKEFVRQWLIENNFQGLDGQTVPAMTPEKVKEISERYIQLFQEITGKTFVPQTKEPEEAVIEKALEQIN